MWVWVCVSLPFQGVESSSDVALYSGLAAGVVTVVLLIIAVTLYRRSQSEYGVDVIDSSALTGGFQSFSFKTSRQGEPGASAGFHPKWLISPLKTTFQKGCLYGFTFKTERIKKNQIEHVLITAAQLCKENLLFCDFKRAIWNDWGLEGFIFCSEPPESHQRRCLGSSCAVHFYSVYSPLPFVCVALRFSFLYLCVPRYFPSLRSPNGA